MSKKGVLIILVVLVALVVLVIAFRGGKIGVDEETAGPEEEGGTETFDSAAPDENLELTETKNESEAAPGSEAKRRVFEMMATKDGYNPEEVVVNQGDTVHFDLKTTGVGYDISLPDMGLYQSIEEGEEKVLEFQALTPGIFTYLCQNICPGGREIKGSLIVKPR